jgi:hypothetical protein
MNHYLGGLMALPASRFSLNARRSLRDLRPCVKENVERKLGEVLTE